MKRLLRLCLQLSVCTFCTATALAKLNVVATTPDLGSLATVVGGDRIELTTLAKPTEDPHFVDAKPSFIVKLNRADVLLEGGAELEVGWLPALLEQARNPKIAAGGPGRVLCAQGVKLLELPSTLDRSRGDIHAAGNPHYLMDPANTEIVARHIAEVFSAQDASSAAVYQGNLKKFLDELNARLVGWQKKMEPFKGSELASYHNSWLYFGDRFGLKIDIFLEPKPGVPPTPSHLAAVIIKMKQDNVRAILVDAYLNRRTAEAVAGRTGATVVDVAQFPGGVRGTEAGYIALMDYLVDAVSRALAKK
jgi:zinc/manganese transport system substrate-binding protein